MAVKVCLCKSCNASITYNGTIGKWKCEYCLSEFDKDKIIAEEQTVEEDLSNPIPEMSEYHCSQCGADLVCEPHTAADFCLYCKSPNIIKSRFSGEFKPKWVIPFTIDKQKAQLLYLDWIQSFKFAPKSFKSSKEVGNIRAMYAPFWLFDSDVSGRFDGVATSTKSRTNGNVRTIETKHFNISRTGSSAYRKVPVDGSTKLKDDLIRGIEPFDYSDLKDFSIEYMAGAFAEKYDVDLMQSQQIMTERVSDYLLNSLKETANGYSKVTVNTKEIVLDKMEANYSMMPLYILTNKYKDVDYTVLINGQTGLVFGEAPIDKDYRLKVLITVFIISWLSMVFLFGVLS